MTPEALAIWGLFFWVWSVERQNGYYRTGSRFALVSAAITVIAASVLLTIALLRALGWFS